MESQDGHHFQSHLDNALDRRNETQPSSDFSLPNTHFNGFFGNDPDPLEESSALKIATPCVKDDQVFIHNVAAGKTIPDTEVTIEGGGRIALVWSALKRLPVRAIRKRVFLQLLRGCDEVDIWLWIDGDEEAMWNPDDIDLADPAFGKANVSGLPWETAAAALQTRLTRKPRSTPLRDRVQSVVPEMRVAMIVWLILTSKAYKDAATEEGMLDLEEWNLELLVDHWWLLVPVEVGDWFVDHEDDGFRMFDAVMAGQGHNCVPKDRFFLIQWLLMRSELFPAQKYNVPAGLKSAACNACLARQPPEHPPPPPWTPPLALVALRFLWDKTMFPEDNFYNWLEQQPLSGIRQVNEALLELHGDDPSPYYLPWVNKYPISDFRDTVVKYTLNEWRSMEDCALWPELEQPRFHVRAWVAAMAWSMLGSAIKNDAELAEEFVWHFRDCIGLCAFLKLLPPPTRSDSFRDAVAKSGHTCWQDEDEDDVMDTYASAMEYLRRKPTVVGADLLRSRDCPVCQDAEALQKLCRFTAADNDNETFVKSLTKSLERESRRRGLCLSLQVRDIATQPNQPAYEDTFPVPRDQQSTAFQVQVVSTTSGPPDPDIHARLIVDSDVSDHLPELEHHLGLRYSTSNARDDIPQTVTAHVDPPWDSHEAPVNQSEIPEYPMDHSHPRSYYYQSGPQVFGYETDGQRWTIDHDSAREEPLRRDSTVVEAVYYQAPGRRSTPLSISDPTGGRVVTEAAVTLAPAYDTPPLNLVADVSLSRRVPAQDGESELCKDDMIKQLKIFFTESFERLGVELHGSKRIKKLPWLQFDETLEKEGIEMVNWPGDVPTPGKGPNSSKGLAGLPVRHLNKIYAAIHRETAKLQLQRIPGARKPGQAVSQQEFFGDDSAVASSSRKRGRDREDEGDTRPKKKQLEGVSRFRIDLMRRSD